MKIIMKHSDWLDDWYTIEKIEHENIQEFRAIDEDSLFFYDSARISDACVEGFQEEMIQIAKAIKNKENISFRRCAVKFMKDGVHFWSPRNSMKDGIVTINEANELADQILDYFK